MNILDSVCSDKHTYCQKKKSLSSLRMMIKSQGVKCKLWAWLSSEAKEEVIRHHLLALWALTNNKYTA